MGAIALPFVQALKYSNEMNNNKIDVPLAFFTDSNRSMIQKNQDRNTAERDYNVYVSSGPDNNDYDHDHSMNLKTKDSTI